MNDNKKDRQSGSSRKRDSFGELIDSPEKKSSWESAIGFIFKAFVLIVVALILTIFFFRQCERKTPSELSALSWTQATADAYKSAGGVPEVFDFKINQYYTQDGYFFADSAMMIPSAEQCQVTVSYNNSTLRYLESEYAGEETNTSVAESDPYGVYSEESEPFIYALYDDKGNVYGTYSYAKGESTLHSFRRLVFDGVPQEGITGLSLAIFRSADLSGGDVIIGSGAGELAPWREIVLVDESTTLKAHKLNRRDEYSGTLSEGYTKVENSLGTDRIDLGTAPESSAETK